MQRFSLPSLGRQLRKAWEPSEFPPWLCDPNLGFSLIISRRIVACLFGARQNGLQSCLQAILCCQLGLLEPQGLFSYSVIPILVFSLSNDGRRSRPSLCTARFSLQLASLYHGLPTWRLDSVVAVQVFSTQLGGPTSFDDIQSLSV
jgi:hypothetical protein